MPSEIDCLCCKHKTPVGGPCTCPECGHVFKGIGWGGIDAHWRSRHTDVMEYEAFLSGLCEEHHGRAGLVDVRTRKYQLPHDFSDALEQKIYERWLQRKASTHLRRDRKRGNTTAIGAEYKVAIHKAVCDSKGLDAYTGEKLDWSLLSQYDNQASKRGGRIYKKAFALLPSLDHVGDGLGPADFKICAWRTNDAKNDLTYEEFLGLCKKVVNAAEEVRFTVGEVPKIEKT